MSNDNVVHLDFTSNKVRKPDLTREQVLHEAILQDFNEKGWTTKAAADAASYIAKSTVKEWDEAIKPLTSVSFSVRLDGKFTAEQASKEAQRQMVEQFEAWAERAFTTLQDTAMGIAAAAASHVAFAAMFGDKK